MKRFFFAQLLKFSFISITALLPAQPVAAQTTRARWLMGTLCEVTAYGPRAGAAADIVFAEIAAAERRLSTYMKNSEVSRLNAHAGAWSKVSAPLWDLLALSRSLHAATGGAFDPTYGGRVRGLDNIAFDAARRRVRLPRGARLDFGAIGKGWALDRAAAALTRAGAHSALINFGGQVLVLGSPPSAAAWPVEAVAPSCAGDGASTGPCRSWTLRLRRGSTAVSDLRERPGHIKDPRSGAVVTSARSVVVAAPSAAEADAWSTALFVAPTLDPPVCALILRQDAAEERGDCRPYDIQEKKHAS